MIKLSAKDSQNLLKILRTTPILANERGREAVLINASLEDVRHQIDLSGPSAVTIPIMVHILRSYGRLTYEHEALGRFLNAMLDFVGLEEQEILEEIISTYQLMTPVAKSPHKVAWVAPISKQEVAEKIIGENTLRPISFLSKGIQAAHSVVYLEVASPRSRWSGSGFMISPRLLLTNHHIIPDRTLLEQTVVRFNYQVNLHGNPELIDQYRAVPNGVYYANKEMDYALIEVEDNPAQKWGHLTLKTRLPRVDDRVNIIQHPNGLPKQVSIQNNFVKFVNRNKLQYITSTLPGSSGSPVLDDEWQVVGLHRAGGWLKEDEDSPTYYRNEGVAIGAILKDLPREIRTYLTIA